MHSVDMTLAAQIMTDLSKDPATATYVTGCLLQGLSLRMLHESGRPHDEIIESTSNVLRLLNSQKEIAQ